MIYKPYIISKLPIFFVIVSVLLMSFAIQFIFLLLYILKYIYIIFFIYSICLSIRVLFRYINIWRIKQVIKYIKHYTPVFLSHIFTSLLYALSFIIFVILAIYIYKCYAPHSLIDEWLSILESYWGINGCYTVKCAKVISDLNWSFNVKITYIFVGLSFLYSNITVIGLYSSNTTLFNKLGDLYSYIYNYIYKNITSDWFICLYISSSIVTLFFSFPFRMMFSMLDLVFIIPLIASFSGGLVYLTRTSLLPEKPSFIQCIITMVICGIFALILSKLILYINENILLFSVSTFTTNCFSIMVLDNYYTWYNNNSKNSINNYILNLYHNSNKTTNKISNENFFKKVILFYSSFMESCLTLLMKFLLSIYEIFNVCITGLKRFNSNIYNILYWDYYKWKENKVHHCSPDRERGDYYRGEVESSTRGQEESSTTIQQDSSTSDQIIIYDSRHPMIQELDNLKQTDISETDREDFKLPTIAPATDIFPKVFPTSIVHPYNKEMLKLFNSCGNGVLFSTKGKNLISEHLSADNRIFPALIDANWGKYSYKRVIEAVEYKNLMFRNFLIDCTRKFNPNYLDTFYKLSLYNYADPIKTAENFTNGYQHVFGIRQLARLRYSTRWHDIGIYLGREIFSEDGQSLKRTHTAIFEINGNYVAFPNFLGHMMNFPTLYKTVSPDMMYLPTLYQTVSPYYANLFVITMQKDDDMIRKHVMNDSFVKNIDSGIINPNMYQNDQDQKLPWNDNIKQEVVNEINNRKHFIHCVLFLHCFSKDSYRLNCVEKWDGDFFGDSNSWMRHRFLNKNTKDLLWDTFKDNNFRYSFPIFFDIYFNMRGLIQDEYTTWLAAHHLICKSIESPDIHVIPRDRKFIPICVSNFVSTVENRAVINYIANKNVFEDNWPLCYIKPEYDGIEIRDKKRLENLSTTFLGKLGVLDRYNSIPKGNDLRDIANKQFTRETATLKRSVCLYRPGLVDHYNLRT